MHTAQGMMKTRVMSPREDQIGKSHLGDSAQSLKIGVFNKVENKAIGNTNKSVNWIIKNFKLVRGRQNFYLFI
jgi:hypothetical protein